MQLYEEYRPETYEDVVAQDKAIEKVQTLRRRGLGGRAFWISGASGTGKTTIGRLIAKDVADSTINVQELDATDLTASRLQDIAFRQRTTGLGGGGRAYIVNEAQGLKPSVVRRLLTLLEKLPDHVVWVFTTTNQPKPSEQGKLFESARTNAKEAGAVLSRCIELKLAQRGLAKPFARKARQIADKEGLNGKSLKAYVRLVRNKRNNMRAVLEAVEAGEMLD